MLFYCYFIVILHKKKICFYWRHGTNNSSEIQHTRSSCWIWLNFSRETFSVDGEELVDVWKKYLKYFLFWAVWAKVTKQLIMWKKYWKKTSKNSASQVESFKNHNKFCIGEGNIWQNLTNFTSFQYFLRVHHIIIRTWLWPLKKLAMPFLVRWHLGKIYW